MIDFDRVRRREATLADLTEGLTVADLAALTVEMIDTMLDLLEGCTDEDVVFVPEDPNAHDSAAADSAEVDLAWTLGHVIVHATASSEEAAFLAAEMARGVERSGRSRYETPWETVTTIAQCYERLAESRRMRLASLGLWPDEPHLEVVKDYSWVPGPVNAVARFVMGLQHDYDHVGQIANIIAQATAARERVVA
jgi:hypothetical protein